jgi:integrase
MASVWIRTRRTKGGTNRYRVEYRQGGREYPARFGGSFKTKRLAAIRAAAIERELADLRIPDLRMLAGPAPSPTLAQAANRWQASRIDAAENTKLQHRSAVNRALPILGRRRVDELVPEDIADLVAQLHAAGKSRESIRKTRTALAMVLDHERVSPNPARDSAVKLPREEREEPQPPSAEHVETVFRLIPSKHRLPLLWLEWSGARVGSVDHVLVGDYDEPRRRVRLRRSWTKTRQGLWVELHPVIADALEAKLLPREDRNPDARLFAGSGADALRTSIAKACRAAGIPVWSPHDLRHRRISLLHRQGRSWAEIGELVGQRSLKVTADTYTHVIVDAELDYAELLSSRGEFSTRAGGGYVA